MATDKERITKNETNITHIASTLDEFKDSVKKHLWSLQIGFYTLVLILIGTNVIQLEDIRNIIAYIF